MTHRTASPKTLSRVTFIRVHRLPKFPGRLAGNALGAYTGPLPGTTVARLIAYAQAADDDIGIVAQEPKAWRVTLPSSFHKEPILGLPRYLCVECDREWGGCPHGRSYLSGEGAA
jgi:hypothetical protein